MDWEDFQAVILTPLVFQELHCRVDRTDPKVKASHEILKSCGVPWRPLRDP